MTIEIISLIIILLLLFPTYFYFLRRVSSKTTISISELETMPPFEQTELYVQKNVPTKFNVLLHPSSPKHQKTKRKFLMFEPDTSGTSTVIVSDVKRSHRSLTYDPRAKGLTPLFAFIIYLKNNNNAYHDSLIMPAGKSISPELYDNSKKNLRWCEKKVLPEIQEHIFL